MTTEESLKQRLLELDADSDIWLGDEERWELAQTMLDYLGSTDSYLRDDLIYSTFARWIYVERRFNSERLQELLQTILDDQHLFYRIGERETDSIFTRSFSLLLVPLVLDAERKQPFLVAAEVEQAQNRLLDYMRQEQDRRGYVPEKGWAHALAHAADALDELVKHGALDASDFQEIINTIRHSIAIPDAVYCYGEEERLMAPLMTVYMSGQLSEADWAEWVRGFVPLVRKSAPGPERLRLRTNIKALLQTFYFRLLWQQQGKVVREVISEALRETGDRHQ